MKKGGTIQKSAKSFDAAFERHFDDVYSYVAYRLAPNIEPAGDITQEVFLAAVAKWNQFSGKGPVLAWLRTIARRKVVDYFRAAAAVRARPDTDAVARASSPSPNPATHRAAAIAQAMRALPENYAQLLEEKYLEGLSVRQIARRRDSSEQAIQAALFRARQAFRNAFLKLQKQEC